jgi:hypothetical protein
MELPEERPFGEANKRSEAPSAALFINLILVTHHEKNKKRIEDKKNNRGGEEL